MDLWDVNENPWFRHAFGRVFGLAEGWVSVLDERVQASGRGWIGARSTQSDPQWLSQALHWLRRRGAKEAWAPLSVLYGPEWGGILLATEIGVEPKAITLEAWRAWGFRTPVGDPGRASESGLDLRAGGSALWSPARQPLAPALAARAALAQRSFGSSGEGVSQRLVRPGRLSWRDPIWRAISDLLAHEARSLTRREIEYWLEQAPRAWLEHSEVVLERSTRSGEAERAVAVLLARASAGGGEGVQPAGSGLGRALRLTRLCVDASRRNRGLASLLMTRWVARLSAAKDFESLSVTISLPAGLDRIPFGLDCEITPHAVAWRAIDGGG